MLHCRKRYGVSSRWLHYIPVILLYFVDSVNIGAQLIIMTVQIVGMGDIYGYFFGFALLSETCFPWLTLLSPELCVSKCGQCQVRQWLALRLSALLFTVLTRVADNRPEMIFYGLCPGFCMVIYRCPCWNPVLILPSFTNLTLSLTVFCKL